MALLRQTPSSALGSCRYKLPDPDKSPETYEKIVARFEELRKIYGSTDATIQLANELYVSVPTIYNIRRRVEKYQKMESNGNQ